MGESFLLKKSEKRSLFFFGKKFLLCFFTRKRFLVRRKFWGLNMAKILENYSFQHEGREVNVILSKNCVNSYGGSYNVSVSCGERRVERNFLGKEAFPENFDCAIDECLK